VGIKVNIPAGNMLVSQRTEEVKDDAHSIDRGTRIAAVSFDARAARAAEGPWCANIDIGTGNVYADCQYYSFEACQPHVLAGNRGFCNLNPRWVRPPPDRRARQERAVRY
jgi:Protein of unknown function (DUF3551)